MWVSGDINTLLLECRTIQGQLTTRTCNNETASEARTFAKLVMEGKYGLPYEPSQQQPMRVSSHWQKKCGKLW